ncbi:hypothetical protein KR054_009511 [Drosophila jambulina]|nr:hypothetical protein KR054_009511 [Drosophila jambulina]
MMKKEASNVESDSEEDLLETMGHGRDEQNRPYFLVNGVPCFTHHQLDLELRKDERNRMDNVLKLIDGESSSPQSLPSNEVQADKDKAERELLRKFTKSLKRHQRRRIPPVRGSGSRL